jgi:hypothetical protein
MYGDEDERENCNDGCLDKRACRARAPHTRGDKGEASMQGSQGTSGLLSSRVCLLLKANGRKTYTQRERGGANSMDTRPKSHSIGALQNAHTHEHDVQVQH